MAKTFSSQQWTRAFARLDGNDVRYGLPEHRAGSVVLASFNIRKLGNRDNKSDGAFELFSRFAARCDLLAVQEVLEDLSGLERIRDAATALAGARYDIVVSDTTGGRGATGSSVERLAFLYRTDRVSRKMVASDLSFDRGYIFETLYDKRADFIAAAEAHTASLAEYDARYEERRAAAEAAGKRKPAYTPPPFVSPHFIDFIRTPHCCAFEIAGAAGADPYSFTAVNAHLLYGDATKQAEERRREFEALIEWLLTRAAKRTSFNDDYLLFGDLNLGFDDPEADRPEIVAKIKGFNDALKDSRAATVVNFPFIDERPRPVDGVKTVLRSNARKDETFDQIGVFAHDPRLPSFELNDGVGQPADGDGFDFNMFDFVSLFLEALHGEGATADSIGKAKWRSLLAHFEHDVSDHMPIWIRLPLPS